MKRLIIAVVLLIGTVAFSVTAICLQNHVLEGISDDLSAIEDAYHSRQYDRCLQLTEQLAEEYPHKTAALEWFVGHNRLHAVYDLLLLLPVTLQEDADRSFCVKLAECKIQLQHLRERGMPTWPNVI